MRSLVPCLAKTSLALWAALCPMLGHAGASPPAQQRTVITYWYNPYRASITAATRAIVAEFERQNPDIQVRVETVGDEITTVSKLVAAVAAGSPPDVYKLDRFTVAERASAHLLEDLSPFMAKEPELSAAYLPAMWAEVLYRGHAYALPMESDARVLFYRRDVLKEEKIQLERLDPTKPPLRLDELQVMADRLTKRNAKGEYVRLGFLPWLGEGWHYTWGFAFGAQFFDPKTCQVTPTDPQLVRSFAWQAELARALGPKQVQSFLKVTAPGQNRVMTPKHPFVTGRLAMMVDGIWSVDELAPFLTKEKWGMTWLPSESGTKFTWSGGFGLTIPKGARRPEAAWRFIRFAAGPEGQRIHLRVAAQLPTWQSLYEEPAIKSLPHLSFFKELSQHAVTRPPLPVGGIYWNELTKAQKAVLFEGAEAEKALRKVEQAVQPKMKRYCPL